VIGRLVHKHPDPGYARVSTAEQESLPEQVAALTADGDRRGWVLVEW
jgi:hypothetical protein